MKVDKDMVRDKALRKLAAEKKTSKKKGHHGAIMKNSGCAVTHHKKSAGKIASRKRGSKR